MHSISCKEQISRLENTISELESGFILPFDIFAKESELKDIVHFFNPSDEYVTEKILEFAGVSEAVKAELRVKLSSILEGCYLRVDDDKGFFRFVVYNRKPSDYSDINTLNPLLAIYKDDHNERIVLGGLRNQKNAELIRYSIENEKVDLRLSNKEKGWLFKTQILKSWYKNGSLNLDQYLEYSIESNLFYFNSGIFKTHDDDGSDLQIVSIELIESFQDAKLRNQYKNLYSNLIMSGFYRRDLDCGQCPIATCENIYTGISYWYLGMINESKEVLKQVKNDIDTKRVLYYNPKESSLRLGDKMINHFFKGKSKYGHKLNFEGSKELVAYLKKK